MNKEETIGFKLVGIETEQFAEFEENFVDEEKVELNTNLSFGMNKDEKVFIATTKFTFENLDKPFLSVQISCFFKIAEDAWNKFKTDNSITLPKGFVAHMTMLTVGTARGVLHSETSGSTFNKYFLPTINVAEMISDDVKFDI